MIEKLQWILIFKWKKVLNKGTNELFFFKSIKTVHWRQIQGERDCLFNHLSCNDCLLFCDHTWVFAIGHCGLSNGIIILASRQIGLQEKINNIDLIIFVFIIYFYAYFFVFILVIDPYKKTGSSLINILKYL
jgi:hypothetical protein